MHAVKLESLRVHTSEAVRLANALAGLVQRPSSGARLNTILTTAGTVGSLVSNFVMRLVIARSFGPEPLGLYAIALGYQRVAGQIADGGLHYAVLRRASVDRELLRSGISLKMVVGLTVALTAGLPLLYGALAVGMPAQGIVPWVLAAWIHLVREIVKDIADEAGDRVIGRRTLPIIFGPRRAAVVAAVLAVLFVPVSLGLPARAHYRAAYYVVALFAQLAVLLVASRLVSGRLERNSLLLKGAMLVGVVALVAGRVA